MSVVANEKAPETGMQISGKFLSFFLSEEECGIEILKVREIIGYTDITPLPKTPEYVRGVLNLRGRIIPVVDLRTKFGMGSVESTQETCIIVVEVELSESETFQMGCVVDRVSEVVTIGNEEIEPTPRFGAKVDTNFILGLGKTKERVLILLDLEKAFVTSELSDLGSKVAEES